MQRKFDGCFDYELVKHRRIKPKVSRKLYSAAFNHQTKDTTKAAVR